MAQNGFISAGEAGPKALSALMKAIELDSTLSQVHYSLALVMYVSKWDWESSEHEFQKAIAINPNNAEANAHYANLLNITGRPKKAEEHIEAALKLDPYNPLIKNIYSVHLLFARKYDDAVKASNEALSMDPTNPVGLFANAFALHMSGKYSEALNAWKASCYNSYKGYKDIVHAFDKGYSNAGYLGALKFEADTLVVQLKGTYYNPTDISTLFLAAGENDKALGYMKIAFEKHDPNLIYVLLPLYDNLRNKPGFQDLCRKMNLPSR
jgi:cytochrome c-type biogenesis protein CcmH/NrfG